MVWHKGNKAAEKWTEQNIIDAFNDTLTWLKDNPQILYVGEVDMYLMETHGVFSDTRQSWMNRVHNNNRSITTLWRHIKQEVENRLIYDNERLRPAIQAMVLQNKHNYADKKEIEVKQAEGTKVVIEYTQPQPKKEEGIKDEKE